TNVCLLALERFLFWTGSSDLEDSISGSNVASYLSALASSKEGDLSLSAATLRNQSASLSSAFEAIARSSLSITGLHDAIAVTKKSSKKRRREALKTRAEKLTNNVATSPILFSSLREVLLPKLLNFDSLLRNSWKEATSVLVSSLYVFCLAARPRALRLLTVEEGKALSQGEPVIRGELKNRRSTVGTVFLIKHKAVQKALELYCEFRNPSLPLFARSSSSEVAYARPADLMKSFFLREFPGSNVTTTEIRRAVESLAGQALSFGEISETERAS
ncbi:MAG: hypothetical protein AAGM67_21140, partial [Bacteroidota bacterium]